MKQRAGAVSLPDVLGTDGRTALHSLDRPLCRGGPASSAARPDARLPAAPRLRPAAPSAPTAATCRVWSASWTPPASRCSMRPAPVVPVSGWSANTATSPSSGRCCPIGRCVRPACWRCAPARSASNSTLSRAEPSPSAIINWPTSMSATRPMCRACASYLPALPGVGTRAWPARSGRRSTCAIRVLARSSLCPQPDAWFAYPFWLDDRLAPDYARTVDIHRKPGYDPCELFFDPRLWAPKGRAAWRLLAEEARLPHPVRL